MQGYPPAVAAGGKGRRATSAPLPRADGDAGSLDPSLASLVKLAARRGLSPVLGKARFQPLFELLYELSLAGLNFGEGNHPRLSGEAFVMRFIRSIRAGNPEPTVIFDVGAHVGVYTLELLQIFADTAVIWAFEPSSSAFQALSENTKEFRNVRARNVGFSDKDSTAVLLAPAERSKLASVHDPSPRLTRMGLSIDHRERVALTTIDRFCEEEGIDHIHFLKLDVEGHELKILQGSQRMLTTGTIDVVQFEFGAANLESRTYFRDFFYLLQGHYAIYRILQDGLCPILRYKETYEVYKRATNYLAVRRGLRVDAGAKTAL